MEGAALGAKPKFLIRKCGGLRASAGRTPKPVCFKQIESASWTTTLPCASITTAKGEEPSPKGTLQTLYIARAGQTLARIYGMLGNRDSLSTPDVPKYCNGATIANGVMLPAVRLTGGRRGGRYSGIM